MSELHPAELLVPFVRHVEREGSKPVNVDFDLSNEDSDGSQLLINHFSEFTFETLDAAIKAAIANEYLKYAYMGSGRVLRLTTKGFQAGKSKAASIQKQQNRGRLKIISDWTNEHNGLTTAYAAVVGTLGLILGTLGIILRWPMN